MEHIEDVFILLRTMFEGYLASRYIDEKYVDIGSDCIKASRKGAAND